jgi:hypothetical protein
MGRSEARAAENEAAFRAANEKIDSKRRELGLDHATPYLCECEDEACTSIVRLTSSEYRRARAEPRRFIVSRGHSHRGRVVDEAPEYVLVEKTGVGGEIAEETAP